MQPDGANHNVLPVFTSQESSPLTSTKKKKQRYYIRHGFRGTRFYSIWVGVRTRCNKKNKNKKRYQYYSGRGLILSRDWGRFDKFYDDMYRSYRKHVKDYGEKETTIERINNNLGYSKKNCRWATNQEQSINKRSNTLVAFKGKIMTISEWAYSIGMKKQTLVTRLKTRKWSVERALSQKVMLKKYAK